MRYLDLCVDPIVLPKKVLTDSREEVRCPSCKTVQFRGKRCIKCRVPFAPVFSDPPSPAPSAAPSQTTQPAAHVAPKKEKQQYARPRMQTVSANSEVTYLHDVPVTEEDFKAILHVLRKTEDVRFVELYRNVMNAPFTVGQLIQHHFSAPERASSINQICAERNIPVRIQQQDGKGWWEDRVFFIRIKAA